MPNAAGPPSPSPRRTRLIYGASIATSGILGISLWIGLLTPLSWFSGFLNTAHYGAAVVAGLLTVLLAKYCRYRPKPWQWILLAPSLIAALGTPLLWVVSIISNLFVLNPSEKTSFEREVPDGIAVSPNGRLEALRCNGFLDQHLFSGWSG